MENFIFCAVFALSKKAIEIASASERTYNAKCKENI